MLAYLIDKGLHVGFSLDFATITQGFHSRTSEHCGVRPGRGDPMQFYKKGNVQHETKGISHFGMIKKLFKELKMVNLNDTYITQLRDDGVEQFLQMWEKSEADSQTLHLTLVNTPRIRLPNH